MRWWSAVIATVTLLLWLGAAAAQPPLYQSSSYVYRIKIGGCTGQPDVRRQTGFRVKGLVGIVTALHGVADCKMLHALNEGNGSNFLALTIQAVDIDHDLALLSSAELAAQPADGLLGAANEPVDYKNLHIVGYPLGLDHQDLMVGIVVSNTQILDNLIPANLKSDALVERQSPNLQMPVLRVQGHLVPGHSGAPLLDSQERAVGVGNGGLAQGQVEIGWAIPWDANIHWHIIEPPELAESAILTRFNALKLLNPQLAFSFSSTYPTAPSPLVTTKTFVGAVTGVNGQPVSGAEVTLSFEDSYAVAVTDSIGRYRFAIPSDDQEKMSEILVEAEGYATVRLNIFDQLPPQISLEAVSLPKPVALEPGQYLLVSWPLGLPLNLSPIATSRRVTMLSQGSMVRVVGGPAQTHEQVWWQVKTMLTDQTGWIAPSDTVNVFVKPLPVMVAGDTVRVTAMERRLLYAAPGSGQKLVTALTPYTLLRLLDGPQELDGYLWYQVERSEDGIRGWVAAAGYGQVYLELAPDLGLTNTPTPTLRSIPTPTPKMTAIPTRSKLMIKVEGAGAVRTINLVAPPMVEQK